MKTCPQCHLAYPSASASCFVDGSNLVAPEDPRIGRTIAGCYVIEDALGVGGMATVYRARHKLVDRPCAIKILAAQYAMDPTLRERFRREARHAQRLTHPNIIEIFDQGETEDGMPFLVMELLYGSSLAAVVDKGILPLARALPIAIEMTRALACAHDFDVIHRDLKPENVFLLPGDHVKLLDFGIARCTQDARITNLGEVFGTPQYMAPERGNSIDAGPTADLYALGILLFEMITGGLPFKADDPAGWLIRHLRDPVPHLRTRLPEAPETLDGLIFALMAKNPADRPVDAHSVEATLESLCHELAITVPIEPELTSPPLSRSVRGPGEAWHRRIQLFEQMLEHAFGSAPPPDLTQMLETLKSHQHELVALRESGLAEQQQLEAIEKEGREGRLRIGKEMDALAAASSKTREEARALRTQVAPLTEACRAFPLKISAAHKEVLRWEGRSGFTEPYQELAAGYHKLGDLMERWYEARRKELDADAGAAEKERLVADVSQQINDLRHRLSVLDKSTEARLRDCQQKIAAMGHRTEWLEADLVHLGSLLCAPLRARSELGALFIELEQVAR
jgi:serine/threonine-protein kinase